MVFLSLSALVRCCLLCLSFFGGWCCFLLLLFGGVASLHFLAVVLPLSLLELNFTESERNQIRVKSSERQMKVVWSSFWVVLFSRLSRSWVVVLFSVVFPSCVVLFSSSSFLGVVCFLLVPCGWSCSLSSSSFGVWVLSSASLRWCCRSPLKLNWTL